MTDPRPTLLLSRPRVDSEAFAARLRARHGADWPVIVAPVIEIVPVSTMIPDHDEVIFTSRHAIAPLNARHAAAGRRAWCVGASTAEAARAAGFEVRMGAGDAAALLELIRSEEPRGRLLHARGDKIAFPLAQRLTAAGIETVEAVLYRQDPQQFSADLLAQIRAAGSLVVPLFSPRSARLLAGQLAGPDLDLQVVAISPAVAEAARPLAAGRVEIAENPDSIGVEEALMRLLGPADPG